MATKKYKVGDIIYTVTSFGEKRLAIIEYIEPTESNRSTIKYKVIQESSKDEDHSFTTESGYCNRTIILKNCKNMKLIKLLYT